MNTSGLELDYLITANASDVDWTIRGPPFSVASRVKGALLTSGSSDRARLTFIERSKRLKLFHQPLCDRSCAFQIEPFWRADADVDRAISNQRSGRLTK